MKHLKPIRVVVASIVGILITLLFLDFTGTIHQWFGWLAKIQLVPAILAGNFIIVAALLLLTFIFGRLYCSVICPLGMFQDSVAWLNRKKNRYSYSKAIQWLRYTVLGLFVLVSILGISSLMTILEPYSAFGRMVQNLLAPIYQWINNLFAYFAERADSYAFYTVDVWIKSIFSLVLAAITFVVLFILAWRNGRTYCNTICPVGTLLGFISRYSLIKVQFDKEQCNRCGKCARNCKASCIDSKNQTIDYSRCVDCFNCIEQCPQHSLKYTLAIGKKNKVTTPIQEKKAEEKIDQNRRNVLTTAGILAVSGAISAQTTKMDGGLAFIEDKKKIERETPISPAGSISQRHFERHCTGCQLCVSVCPNKVLRPSTNILTLLQPTMSYELGYCRPECTKCSEVCPTGAINLIDKATKSSTQIGHAIWVEANCVVNTDGVSCGNCARHCPSGAITMITREQDELSGLQIPMIDTERCIGCGACEFLCPARPFSAIYVEGHRTHREI